MIQYLGMVVQSSRVLGMMIEIRKTLSLWERTLSNSPYNLVVGFALDLCEMHSFALY